MLKMIGSIVLGKEGGKVKKEIFHCPVQITAAPQTLERMVFIPGNTSHVNPGSPIIMLGAVKLGSWVKKTLAALLPHLTQGYH